MDCVNDEGDAFVAYAGRVRWNGLGFGYTSTLTARAGRAVESRISLRQRKPTVGSSEVSWRGLNCTASWAAEPGTSPIRRRLYSDTAGTIDWECLLPSARARVELPDGASLTGRGYVEHLAMTSPPWTVKFRELHWGRFHGDRGETVVWIDARGARPFRYVFRNEQEEREAEVGERSIDFADGGARLTMEEGTLLRSGRLSNSALSAWPLPWLLPARVLSIDESKRFGHATLARPGHADERGTALFEVVRWP